MCYAPCAKGMCKTNGVDKGSSLPRSCKYSIYSLWANQHWPVKRSSMSFQRDSPCTGLEKRSMSISGRYPKALELQTSAQINNFRTINSINKCIKQALSRNFCIKGWSRMLRLCLWVLILGTRITLPRLIQKAWLVGMFCNTCDTRRGSVPVSLFGVGTRLSESWHLEKETKGPNTNFPPLWFAPNQKKWPGPPTLTLKIRNPLCLKGNQTQVPQNWQPLLP